MSPATDDAPFVITVNSDRPGRFLALPTCARRRPGHHRSARRIRSAALHRQLLLQGRLPHACRLPVRTIAAPRRPLPAPDINYLAKDYGASARPCSTALPCSFPSWTETHAADLGIAMVETLAYAADHLSYQQDAVSTEAYIGTARSRDLAAPPCEACRLHSSAKAATLESSSHSRSPLKWTTSSFRPGPLLCQQPGMPVSVRWSDPFAQQLIIQPAADLRQHG